MSKIEHITKYIKNAKINNQQLQKICYCFAHDFTASATAQELGLSRQTINSYYKMMREFLLSYQDNIDYEILNTKLQKNFFLLKYITFKTHTIYYIEYKNFHYIIDNTHLKNIFNFVNTKIQNKLISYTKINTARVLYHEEQKEYFVSTYLHSNNPFEKYLTQRLKKFRGLNKNNSMIHIKESLIRYEYNEKFLCETLSSIFKSR